MPAGRGKKGSQAPRRRKDALTPTVRTDRINENTQSVSASGDDAVVCQAIAGNNGPTVNISLDSGIPAYSSTSGYPGQPCYVGASSYPGPSSYSYAPTYPSYGWPAGVSS